MNCANCGFDNPSEMSFCGRCGQPLQKICKHCGFTNPADFNFCGKCANSLETEAAATPPSALTESTRSTATPVAAGGQDAEHRQLTVMFCDIVGSSTLSEQVDAEELRHIIAEYHSTCNAVIQSHGGHIAQYLGDGVLVYFGYPTAAEDDALRAMEGAQGLLCNIARLNQRLMIHQPTELAVRIGIHTGLAVVGRLSEGDKRSLALGDTPNIAARLQDIGEPNTITISAASHRLIERHFVCEALGKQTLRGFSRPIETYKLLKRRELPRISHPFDPMEQTPLVGRNQETELLLDRLEQAKKGAGHVILLSGEAGLGKSRLVALIREQMQGEPHKLVECWGSQHYKNSYLFPLINLLRWTLDLRTECSDDDALARLEEIVAANGLVGVEAVPPLADLLSLPLPEERYPAQPMTPQQKKQRTLKTMLQMLRAMASRQTVLFIVEDLHWVDPSTLEFLGMLIEAGPIDNLFCLFTYRTEFIPPWPAYPHLSKVALNRLTRKQAGSMIRWVTNGKTLPVEVFSQIVD